jgi:hypothetical protein
MLRPASAIEIEVLQGDWRHAVRPEQVEARLRKDTGHSIKAILAVHIDASTGILTDIAAIGGVIAYDLAGQVVLPPDLFSGSMYSAKRNPFAHRVAPLVRTEQTCDC